MRVKGSRYFLYEGLGWECVRSLVGKRFRSWVGVDCEEFCALD